MFQLIWLGCAIATGCAIALDMHRLRAHSVGMTLGGWIVASVCTGPLAGVIYLSRRRTARRTLIDAAWTIVGDATVPVHVRRERLNTLERAGLLGASIYRECAAVLDTESSTAGRSVNGEPNTSHPSDGTPDPSL
ncbi:hypothetical protein BLA9940_00026 [Burkholderia aenigmatica]|nr:hypothetical protein CVS37_28650 [Burkholderia lata]VWC30240.1 hypothetical protein BLA9940_00026 [Burkholderia aenigmatica]